MSDAYTSKDLNNGRNQFAVRTGDADRVKGSIRNISITTYE